MTEPQNDNVIRFEKKQPVAPQHPPLINLPPATKYLAALIAAAHIILWGTQFYAPMFNIDQFYYDYGFVSAKWSGNAPFLPRDILSLVTVNFLHGGWFHLIINCVTFIAFAAGVERRMGQTNMLVIFFASSALALLVHFCITPNADMPVIGASGGISGLFGAVLIMLKQDGQLSSNNRILPIIIVWVVISVVFGLMGGPDGTSIAWVAHIGGFFAGLGIAYLMLNKKVTRA